MQSESTQNAEAIEFIGRCVKTGIFPITGRYKFTKTVPVDWTVTLECESRVGQSAGAGEINAI